MIFIQSCQISFWSIYNFLDTVQNQRGCFFIETQCIGIICIKLVCFAACRVDISHHIWLDFIL